MIQTVQADSEVEREVDDCETTKTDHAHRARNPHLAKLDIVNLRKIAQQHGLDASHLRYKVPHPHPYHKPRSSMYSPPPQWQYIDTISRHHSVHDIPIIKTISTYTAVKPTATRPTFLSLPAELRNKIYAQVLTCPSPISIHSSSNGTHMQLHERMVQQSRWTYNLRSIPHPDLQQIRTFFALSLANAQVGCEARTFFYAHNDFRFCAMPLRVARPAYPRPDGCVIHAPPYFEAYAGWLGRLGGDGRAVVRSLRFSDERERWEDLDSSPGAMGKFFGLLQECGNLTRLTLSVTADHVTASDPGAYHAYLIHRGTLPRKAIRHFAEQFAERWFPWLEEVEFLYTVSEREYMAYDGMAVGRKRRSARMADAVKLVVQRVWVLMESLKHAVERKTKAMVRVRRVPLVRMQAAKWRDVNATKDVYVQRYRGLVHGSLQAPGDGRMDWRFADNDV
jgi:hypothetical protein